MFQLGEQTTSLYRMPINECCHFSNARYFMCRKAVFFVLTIALLSLGVLPCGTCRGQFWSRKGIVLDPGFGTLQGDVDYWAYVANASIVRYQIMLTRPGDYAKSTTLQHIEWINGLMPTITNKGMILVVDFHCPNRNNASFEIDNVATFVDDWARIVGAIGHHPSANLAFELANEQESPYWRDTAFKAASRIRKVEKNRGFERHPICFSPRGATTIPARSFVKLDIEGPQVLTFHFWNWRTPGANVQNTPPIYENSPPSELLPYTGNTPSERSLGVICARLDEIQACGWRNGCATMLSEVGIDYRHPDAPAFVSDMTREATLRGINVTWHANDSSKWVGSKTSVGQPGFQELLDWMRVP